MMLHLLIVISIISIISINGFISSNINKGSSSSRVSDIVPRSYKDKLPVSSLTKPLLSIGAFVSGLIGKRSSASSSALSDRYPSKMTNTVVSTVDGIKQKRLGGGDIIVSEMALGTQRWVSGDFNSPNEDLCHQFMDRAILNSGINLIDTAEQYPIPSTVDRPEGLVETTIGKWIAKGKGRREKVVIATKITGGKTINKRSIQLRCEGSLKRLGTDYIDIYQLHWPARYAIIIIIIIINIIIIIIIIIKVQSSSKLGSITAISSRC